MKSKRKLVMAGICAVTTTIAFGLGACGGASKLNASQFTEDKTSQVSIVNNTTDTEQTNENTNQNCPDGHCVDVKSNLNRIAYLDKVNDSYVLYTDTNAINESLNTLVDNIIVKRMEVRELGKRIRNSRKSHHEYMENNNGETSNEHIDAEIQNMVAAHTFSNDSEKQKPAWGNNVERPRKSNRNNPNRDNKETNGPEIRRFHPPKSDFLPNSQPESQEETTNMNSSNAIA